jgi:exopolysaccharide production protein ExoZ
VEKINSLQVLRFFAAALVLLAHIENRVANFGERFHVPVSTIGFSGQFGVDIFFVISGFIMGWLSLRKFGQPGAPGNFILDRITRIVPLYWICTLATACFALLAAALGDPERANVPTFDQLLKSLLFIPFLDERGMHRPALGQGWTLDFEMMFYGILAICLLLKRPLGPLALAAAFLTVYALGAFPQLPIPLRVWSDPIIFEFLSGVALAFVRERIGLIVPIKANTALLLAVIGLMTLFGSQHEWTLLLNAIVATLLVAVCVLGQDIKSGSIDKVLVKFGDWSYSLYLTHGFVLLFVGIAWRKVFGAEHLWAYAATIVVFSLALSYLSYSWIERPFTALLRSKSRTSSVRSTMPTAAEQSPPSS